MSSCVCDGAGERAGVTWMGHSTLLVEIDGVRVLIDPVWDERASPMRWTGPKRFLLAGAAGGAAGGGCGAGVA